MAMPAELQWVEDLVVPILRRAYPEEITGSALAQQTDVDSDALRAVLAELEEMGVAFAGEDGWAWVDPEAGAPLPIPGEVPPAPVEEEADDAPADDYVMDDVVDAEVSPGGPEIHYEARIGVKLSFGSFTDEHAVNLARGCERLIQSAIAQATSEIDAIVMIEQVKAYAEPREVEV